MNCDTFACLSDAINGGERTHFRWCDNRLPDRVENLLITIEQVSDSLSGIVGLLEADEALADINNRGSHDYSGLSLRTRLQLFQACRHLSVHLTNQMAEIAGVELKRGES